MSSLVKCVLFEYCTFFMRITLDAPTIASTKFNLCLLIDVKMLLKLNAIMPLLEVVHSLIKFFQLCDVFVCDFVATMKICEFGMYISVLWQPILFPRWCVLKFPCPYQFCSWEHKPLVEHKSKYKNKSLSFWVCWATTCLGHICKSDWGIRFHDKTCVWKGCGICETKMYRSFQSISYKIVIFIPKPRFDGCIWGCVQAQYWLQLKPKLRLLLNQQSSRLHFANLRRLSLMKCGFQYCFQPLPLICKDLCLSLPWRIMLNWQCKNHLISTHLPNYGEPFFILDSWTKSPWVHQVTWTCYGASEWFNSKWIKFFYIHLYEN
jgi:hypothetical protein